MKRLILILSITYSTSVFSQSPIVNDYVVTTPNRDVIWIIDNMSGRMIYQSWTCSTCDNTWNGITPKVHLVDPNQFKKLTRKYKKK